MTDKQEVLDEGHLIPYRETYVGMGPTYLGSQTIYLEPEKYQQRIERDKADAKIHTRVAIAAVASLVIFYATYFAIDPLAFKSHEHDHRPTPHQQLTTK